MTTNEANNTTKPMSSALKLLRLLDVVGETTDPVRVAELARAVGATRSEVHRQLVTLVAAGWMEQLPDGAYQLTVKAAHLGNAALQHAGFGERVSRVLADLAERIGQSVCLAVLDDDATRVVKRAEPGTAAHVTLALGRRMSLRGGATGRVLIAHADDATLAALRERGVPLPDDEELVEIREAGYALIPEYADEGLAAIAFPLVGRTGRPTVTLCAVGPATRFDPLSAKDVLTDGATDLARLTAGLGDGHTSWTA
ncbi:IclR family transcriptional regulator [Streptomyces sp. NBC_01016]|uniref:IclR family transcriptional regulator n=1 Tax=Streptomyces sp. NBC_01016 TaxID=2903720 RepID=UPI0022552349|nr:IclR family transcriptional regulator [Streptomyces sp. NBC_01016]MCX4832236.1 IclR family transcriptional regulator [Streptomyces sp. NBC_01016]